MRSGPFIQKKARYFYGYYTIICTNPQYNCEFVHGDRGQVKNKSSLLSGTGSVAYECTGTEIKQSPQYMGGLHGFHPLILYLAIPSPAGLNLRPFGRTEECTRTSDSVRTTDVRVSI